MRWTLTAGDNFYIAICKFNMLCEEKSINFSKALQDALLTKYSHYKQRVAVKGGNEWKIIRIWKRN